jgi:hypothetical protein
MKAEKTLLIEDVLRRVNASPFLFVVDYTGLTVDKFAELRKRLRGCGSEIHVFKNTLVKKAADKAGYPADLAAALTGQSAVVTGALAVAIASFRVGTRQTLFAFFLFNAIYLVGVYLLDRLPATHVPMIDANGALVSFAGSTLRAASAVSHAPSTRHSTRPRDSTCSARLSR